LSFGGNLAARRFGTFATLSAPNGRAELHDECRLSEVKRKGLGHR
jgi:hypothetical protein